VFNDIKEDVKKVLSDTGLTNDDDMLFNMFNIAILSYAYSAYDRPKMDGAKTATPLSGQWKSIL